MNIACVLDINYLQHCAVMLKTLRIANPDEKLCVYILHDGLYGRDVCSFAEFAAHYLDTLSFLQIDSSKIKHFPVSHHVTLTSYFRLLLPNVLPAEMNRVLFLDTDMVINRSLSDLWDTDLKGKSLGAVVGPNTDRDGERLKFSPGQEYFNAGVMLIDLRTWRKINILDESIRFVRDFPERIVFWDQDVLNHIFQNEWLSLDPKWNELSHLKKKPGNYSNVNHENNQESLGKYEPCIIHFAGGGSNKPWHYKCHHPLKDKYLESLRDTPWDKSKLQGFPTLSQKVKWRIRQLYRKAKIILKRYRTETP